MTDTDPPALLRLPGRLKHRLLVLSGMAGLFAAADRSPGTRAEALLLFVTLAAVSLTIFGGALPRELLDSLPFLVLPFVLWAAFRFSQRETASAVVLASGIAIWGTVRGHGPFARPEMNTSLLLLVCFVSVVAMTGAALAAAVGSQRRSQGQLLAINETLEERIDERTHELAEANETLRTEVEERIEAGKRLRRAKREAERANRAKSRFLAIMSHELRTPLNSVIGFATALGINRHGRLDQRDLTLIERIRSNGVHLLALINNILDLTRIESEELTFERVPVDLAQLVEGVVADLGGGVKADLLTLSHHVPPALEPLHTDPLKLRQVVINLLGNALKFTEEGEIRILVESSSDGRPRRLLVEDNGIGIPADRLDVIFEPFEQARSGIERPFDGSGLGLTISRSLCRGMGYDLSVTSEEGQGSCFTIDFEPRKSSRSGGRAMLGG